MTTWKRWQDYLTVLLGVVLFITPFSFGATSNTTAAWTAYVVGVLLVLGGLWAASTKQANTTEWVPVILAVILFISPWVVGFTAVGAIAWSAWIIGVLAFLSAGSLIVMSGRTSMRPTPSA